MDRSCLLLSLTLLSPLRAQESYFQEERLPWWRPSVNWNTVYDHIELGPGRPDIERTRGHLRLRWELGREKFPFRLILGSASHVGSDGNRNNLPRFDNQRSNGTELDIADLQFRWIRPHGAVELHGGLIENPLLISGSLWDENLRLMGGGGRFFLRSQEGIVQELGLRSAFGDVRLIEGGRVKLNAVQGVFSLETGLFRWTAHGGQWKLEARDEDASKFRRQNPGTSSRYNNPEFRFRTYGFNIELSGALPLELKALRHEDQNSDDRGEEFQAWVGSKTRKWWPMLGYMRQRLDPRGALASINGDQWWFHANADGQRYVLAFNLPKRFRLTADYVEQTRRGVSTPVKRSTVALSHRF